MFEKRSLNSFDTGRHIKASVMYRDRESDRDNGAALLGEGHMRCKEASKQEREREDIQIYMYVYTHTHTYTCTYTYTYTYAYA